ncbi:MAG: DUF4384 domain-containing protein [Desulfobacterales bacterium]|nr:MAG: DUF4384 domain-containing protein [Desulfobacterales bacterium]
MKRSLPARKPSLKTKTGTRATVVGKRALPPAAINGAGRAETLAKAAPLSPKIVQRKATQTWRPALKSSTWSAKVGNFPDGPPQPKRLQDDLAELVRRLVQPATAMFSDAKVRVQANNLTFRDMGVESEATKLLTRLVQAEMAKMDQIELLSPADVSQSSQLLLAGEIWDHPEEVAVRLRFVDRQTRRELNAAESKIPRQQLPDNLQIQPPPGKNLTIIQRVVALMKRHFPQGGDFQLGVWPDKGLDAVYVEGEKLMVYILPETDAYLQVDYYQVDGKVVHLLPNRRESNFVEAGKPYIIGQPKSGGYEFIVSAPFGQELLVVVASPKPIGGATPELIEPAGPYIGQLNESWASRRKKAAMAGAHYIILTKGRRSEDVAATPFDRK